MADQGLFKNGQTTTEAFVRGGFGTPNYSFVRNYFDAGLNFIGLLPNRDGDVLGIAIGRSGISNQFSRSRVAQGGRGFTSETVIEVTYKLQLDDWASIQPDFQFRITPVPSAVRATPSFPASAAPSPSQF